MFSFLCLPPDRNGLDQIEKFAGQEKRNAKSKRVVHKQDDTQNKSYTQGDPIGHRARYDKKTAKRKGKSRTAAKSILYRGTGHTKLKVYSIDRLSRRNNDHTTARMITVSPALPHPDNIPIPENAGPTR